MFYMLGETIFSCNRIINAERIIMHRSNYSKINSSQREISVDALNKIARYFGMTIARIMNFDDTTPQEVTTDDKTLVEQVKVIWELENITIF